MNDHQPQVAIRAPIFSRSTLHRAIATLLLIALIVACFAVLQPFFAAIVWAAILSYIAWPLLTRAQAWLGGNRHRAALALALVIAVFLLFAIVLIVITVRDELKIVSREVNLLLQNGVSLPESLRSIPVIGPWLNNYFSKLGADRSAWMQEISKLFLHWDINPLKVAGDFGLNALRFVVAVIASYFMLCSGDKFLFQLRKVLRNSIGAQVDLYFTNVGDTTRAVVYGLLLAALGQGLMAMLGYWAAGISTPVFWGVITTLVAMIPFGAPLIWGAIGGWLLLQGQLTEGIGLLIWGVVVVSSVDNLVRTMVISSVAKIPFLLVLLGVLGGLTEFGLVGVFAGPVALALLLGLWRQWTADTRQP
jgi:predicted PurR-regulated permease PerM